MSFYKNESKRNVLSFSSFIFEAAIEDDRIKNQLERFYNLQEEIKEMKARLKEAEDEFKGFEITVKPMLDSLKELDDKIGETERFIVQINRYGHTRTDIGWKSVVESAMEKVDDAAQEILRECMEASKKTVDVKHSFEIKMNESKLLASLKSAAKRILDSFTRFFTSRLNRIDAQNKKLAVVLAKVKKK